MNTLDSMFRELPDDVIKANALRWLANNPEKLRDAIVELPLEYEHRHELLILSALADRLGKIYKTGSGK